MLVERSFKGSRLFGRDQRSLASQSAHVTQ